MIVDQVFFNAHTIEVGTVSFRLAHTKDSAGEPDGGRPAKTDQGGRRARFLSSH
ncbi:hypothetical protein ACFVU4_02920 [Streptomyces sp. NPDC058107]|uniref:hypothetical protein n=1 Tax=Streptomyces sp. NPDC058107 TaxID=3346343 RepID=UPI0036DFA7BE